MSTPPPWSGGLDTAYTGHDVAPYRVLPSCLGVLVIIAGLQPNSAE
jgi:hypothetical protein